jgi:tetraacyldisaccharide 4'-kinase|tara:strand:- start:701 stop:1639 length:939 start_codon:yes stop_codon:yes gene_type:complete
MKLKKPKFWDDKKPCFLSYFFLPLTLPIIVNNFFLKRKIKQSNQKIKKICVGNIYVGGTAKTPLTVKIYKILKDLKYNTATIKKYYKNQIDEQKILNSNTRLYCEKNRNLALSQAIKDSVHVVIFDDGLQDRSMSYDLSFVCFNNIKWVGNGFLIPAGPLREKIESISRYDAIFLNGNERDNSDIKSVICKYNKEIPVFESTYKASNIDQFDTNAEYIIFSGIGNPESFKETVINNKLKVVKEFIFPDHYQYTENDINNITLHAKRLNAKILTTEKDYTKINYNKKYDIKCLKIELTIKDEQKLINFLKLYI